MFMAKLQILKKLQQQQVEIMQQNYQQMTLLNSMKTERRFVMAKYKKLEIVYHYQNIASNN